MAIEITNAAIEIHQVEDKQSYGKYTENCIEIRKYQTNKKKTTRRPNLLTATALECLN